MGSNIISKVKFQGLLCQVLKQVYYGNYEIATFRCDRLMDFVLHETFYGSHLWEYKIVVRTGYYYSLKICIDLKINSDLLINI